MRRAVIVVFFLVVALAAAGAAYAQEEAHYEGYSMGSNPSPAGTPMNGRGLVTALYPPLVKNFALNEYTWVFDGLVSLGSALKDSVYYTNYIIGPTVTFSIYEDPAQDASPTFYNCPSDIVGVDPRYSNGALYLRGHFTQYSSTFDIHTVTYGQGTYTARLNWDSGLAVTNNWLPAGKRGGWTFGGTSTSAFTCIPAIGDPNFGPYQQALTGRIFQTTTKVQTSTWGTLRTLYH
jgi:hypothetical protein